MTDKGYRERVETTTALMAALGMGGGAAWVQPDPSQRDALMLDAVKVALELGADVNVTNTDGRTALDAARAVGNSSVVALLVERPTR